MCYVTNVGWALSNQCLISPGIHSHVSQGQTAIRDVSVLSMKTGRAMLLQILTSGESQAIQCTMRSHRSLYSQQFASAKTVIDICQRKMVVHVSSKAAGRWRKAGGHAWSLRYWRHMPVRHHLTSPLLFVSLCFIINIFIPWCIYSWYWMACYDTILTFIHFDFIQMIQMAAHYRTHCIVIQDCKWTNVNELENIALNFTFVATLPATSSKSLKK